MVVALVREKLVDWLFVMLVRQIATKEYILRSLRDKY